MIDGYGLSIQMLFTDSFSIVSKTKYKDSNGATRFREETIASGIPCRVSFQTLSSVNGDNVQAVGKTAKLFCSPSITVPEGSHIVVLRKGKEMHFRSSGDPAIYEEHQEIMMETAKDYA